MVEVVVMVGEVKGTVKAKRAETLQSPKGLAEVMEAARVEVAARAHQRMDPEEMQFALGLLLVSSN